MLDLSANNITIDCTKPLIAYNINLNKKTNFRTIKIVQKSRQKQNTINEFNT